MLYEIFSHYDLPENDLVISAYGSGLINSTWKVSSALGQRHFLLQRVNDSVFKRPDYISQNIRLIAEYFKKNHPDYLFIAPLPTAGNDDLVFDTERGFFRVFPFLEGSHSIDVVTTHAEAYEAANAFATFTKLLAGFDISRLKITLEDFHNLTLRFQQFQQAVSSGNAARIRDTQDLIGFLESQESIVLAYERLRQNPEFKIRVTHHDTKISNVLFDEDNRAVCVIDLDTVMPGYFISDVGDMMRTYLPSVSEEADTSTIIIRDEIFEAIAKGYLSLMKNELTDMEKDHFVYAGKFMIYMQALRFLTDYLNNDIYYTAAYEGQNLVRAKNQIALLKALINKQTHYQEIVSSLL